MKTTEMKPTTKLRYLLKDMENDLVHKHLVDKGFDPRMCEPNNPDTDYAELQ